MLNTLRHSSQQTRFIVRPVHIGFVVYRVALCHISVRVLWFSCSYHSTNVPTSFIHLPSMLHHPNINTSLTIQNTKLSFRVCTHNPPPRHAHCNYTLYLNTLQFSTFSLFFRRTVSNYENKKERTLTQFLLSSVSKSSL